MPKKPLQNLIAENNDIYSDREEGQPWKRLLIYYPLAIDQGDLKARSWNQVSGAGAEKSQASGDEVAGTSEISLSLYCYVMVPHDLSSTVTSG